MRPKETRGERVAQEAQERSASSGTERSGTLAEAAAAPCAQARRESSRRCAQHSCYPRVDRCTRQARGQRAAWRRSVSTEARRERRAPRAGGRRSPQARARTRGVTANHATATRSRAAGRAPRRRRCAGGARTAAGASAALLRAEARRAGRCSGCDARGEDKAQRCASSVHSCRYQPVHQHTAFGFARVRFQQPRALANLPPRRTSPALRRAAAAGLRAVQLTRRARQRRRRSRDQLCGAARA